MRRRYSRIRLYLRALFSALVGIGLVVVSAPSAAIPEDLAHIVQVNRFPSRSSARLVIYLSKPVHYEIEASRSRIPDGGIAVKLTNTTFKGPSRFVLGGLVAEMRLSSSGRNVFLSLHSRVQMALEAFYLPEPFRLVVDVRPLASDAIDYSRPIRRIALDPGHGGEDPGAQSGTGLQEKDVVLDIALRAAPLIARELGIATLLTRDSDEKVPLEERVAKANAFGADLFISVHCNADKFGRGHGFMTFVLDGTRSGTTGHSMARENGGLSDDLRYIRQFLPEEPTSEHLAWRSRRFAELLQMASEASLDVNGLKVRNGGVHGAGFYVLAGAQMPAVLFESSFISHPLEGWRLGRASYRQQLADSIVNAVRAYGAGF